VPTSRVKVWAASRRLAAGKQVAAVKLPQNMDIHVFAVAAG